MEKQVKKDIEKLRALGLEKPGFKAPSNYFEEFSDILFTKIDEEKFPEKTGFIAPDSYFENIEASVLSSIDLPKNKKSTKIRILYAISTVAAAIVLYFGLARYEQSETVTFDSLTSTDVESWIISGNMNIDSYDIASIETDEIWNTTLEIESLTNEEINNYLDTVEPEFLFLEN